MSKGKFVNTFQSMQMLGDYDANNPDDESPNGENPNEQNLNGDELYNPLEGLDDESRDQSPELKSQETKSLGIDDKVDDKTDDDMYSNIPQVPENLVFENHSPFQMDNEITNENDINNKLIAENIPVDNNTTDDNSQSDDMEIASDTEENVNINESMNNNEQVNKITQSKDESTNIVVENDKTNAINKPILLENEQLKEIEKPDKASESQDTAQSSLFEDDELLGTALAELEQEEREEKEKLTKLIEKEKEEEKPKKKKKKKSKDKLKDKDGKKKKKKKKNKLKNKDDSDSDKKKKKKEKKKEKKEKDKKEKKEKVKEKELKKDKSTSELKEDKKVKGDSKDNDEKRSKVNKEAKKHSDSKSSSKKSSDSKVSRKRSSRENSVETQRKRSRKDSDRQDDRRRRFSPSPIRRKNRSRSPRRKSKSPDVRKKSEEQKRSRSPHKHSRSPHKHSKSPRKHASEKRDTSKTRHKHDLNVDYEVKVPEKQTSQRSFKSISPPPPPAAPSSPPPPLSREEFYKKQNQLRIAMEKAKQRVERTSSEESNDEKPVATVNPFLENYSKELSKYRAEIQNESLASEERNEKLNASANNESDNMKERKSKSISKSPLPMDSQIDTSELLNLKDSTSPINNKPASPKDLPDNETSETNNNIEDSSQAAMMDSSSDSDAFEISTEDTNENKRSGSLSLNEYKRRKQRHNAKKSSSRDCSRASSRSKKSPGNLWQAEKEHREHRTKSPTWQHSDKENNGFIETKSEKEVVENKATNEDGGNSPYNPEKALPLDFTDELGPPRPVSPGIGAVEDEKDIDFGAYKEVVAFQDIMKSKVKHEARRHKKRKQQEAKTDGEPALVDYLNRQAQVEEMMKSVLKTYFRAKEITKDEYKNILKKAVPQVTHSDSPLIREKIESLMTKFVRKCKGSRSHSNEKKKKKMKINPEDFQEIRVLPNLPMPPSIEL